LQLENKYTSSDKQMYP